jgi:hypothetical protein
MQLNLNRLESWSMGTERPMSKYMEMVGLDMTKKKVRRNDWCHRGHWPQQALPYKT